VPVNIDDPHPAGSSGLTQALLALTYDPTAVSVSAAGIHLGSVPVGGNGWTLQSRVDPVTGQIGIILFSTTPIAGSDGGSLVTIDFHVQPGAPAGLPLIQLAASVNPNDRGVIQTVLDDLQGPLTLHPLASDDTTADPGLTPGTTVGQPGTITATAARVATTRDPALTPDTAPLAPDAPLVSRDASERGLPDAATQAELVAEVTKVESEDRGSQSTGSGPMAYRPGSGVVTVGGTSVYQASAWALTADPWGDGRIAVPAIFPPQFLPLGNSFVSQISAERDMADVVFCGADQVFVDGSIDHASSQPFELDERLRQQGDGGHGGWADRFGLRAPDETAAALAVLDEYFAQTGSGEIDLG
jgi:hypothetical protein